MAKPVVIAYIDGSSKVNPGPGGWGVVLVHEQSGKTKHLSGGVPDTTNNRMEIQAAIETLRALKVPGDITIYTDSQYLMRGWHEWLPGWKRQNWLKSNGDPVLNLDLWQALEAAAEPHVMRFEWVRGHDGHPGNEAAHDLASSAAEKLVATGDTGPWETWV